MNLTIEIMALSLLSGSDTDPLQLLSQLLFMLLPCVIIVLVGGLVVFFTYYSYRQEKQRTADLQRVADELGFEFLPQGDNAFLSNQGSSYLFSLGRSKRFSNLMRGKTKNLNAAVFDYRYITGSGRRSHTWSQTVVGFQLDAASLPTFSLRPESMWDKVGEWFGYQDINFESYPVFSKNFLLRGSDEMAIRNLFTDAVLMFVETKLGCCIEGDGNWLLFYRHNRRVDPTALRALLEEGVGVVEAFHLAPREEF